MNELSKSYLSILITSFHLNNRKMYRTTNARGLSSLSNVISTASDLPPLNPSSGSVYQPPNSTGSRNSLIETQRMRTIIMGQIQAVQSDQDRQMQQSEARISMVLRELSPKIQNLDRHSSFNQQQLDDLVERLSQLDSVMVPSIQQKCDEVQLKFEQSIRTETQSKFKPMSDDIKLEQSKSEQLSDSATSSVSNTNNKLKELSLLYDALEKQVSETHNYVQNHIITINPRLSTIETKLISYEGAAESSLKTQAERLDFQHSTKKLRKDLEDLEVDGIPLAIQSAASDTLAHITSVSSQIEQKFASSKLSLSSIDSSIKMTVEQQKNVDSHIESLSKSSIDTQTSIDIYEQEVNTKLSELEESIKSINEEIGGKLNELQENNSGNSHWVLDVLNDDIRSLQDNARQYLTQLNQDWIQFHKDNGEAQKITDSEIDKLSTILNGEFSLLKKIKAAEERSKWCLNRIQVWQKEAKEAEQRNVDDEKLVQKLETLEAKLKESESRLAAIDKQKAPKKVKISKEKFNEADPIPQLAEPGNEIEPLSIPAELKLTYNDQDEEIVLPDLLPLEERKMKLEKAVDENSNNSKKKKKQKEIKKETNDDNTNANDQNNKDKIEEEEEDNEDDDNNNNTKEQDTNNKNDTNSKNDNKSKRNNEEEDEEEDEEDEEEDKDENNTKSKSKK